MTRPTTNDLFVFILAGGSGERFWPLSRTAKPKHLLRLLGEHTLLEDTVLRVKELVPEERIFVLTNHAQIHACREAASMLPAAQFVAEPEKRDTAPAAALATGLAHSRNPEAKCLLLPADACIHNAEAFRANVRDAVSSAQADKAILTFSIPPTHAATGFGYLELGESLGGGILEVKRFVEKPDEDTAEAYVASGRFGWNAGMFLWRARIFLRECERLAPELAAFIKAFPGGDPASYLDSTFAALPKISVDYAILERADKVVAMRAEFDWDDVGSWTALPNHLGKDPHDNTVRGKTALLDADNNIVVGQGRTIALCGVSDLVVVETDDAVLVCHRNAVQRIKNLQPLLPESVR